MGAVSLPNPWACQGGTPQVKGLNISFALPLPSPWWFSITLRIKTNTPKGLETQPGLALPPDSNLIPQAYQVSPPSWFLQMVFPLYGLQNSSHLSWLSTITPFILPVLLMCHIGDGEWYLPLPGLGQLSVLHRTLWACNFTV